MATSRMGRRTAAMLALCATLPLLVFALGVAWDADFANARLVANHLSRTSSLYADIIRSRLGSAQIVVESVTANDIGADEAALKRQIVNSRVFESAVLIDRDGRLPSGETALRPNAAQRLALEAGQTVLMPLVLERQLPGLFMVRQVKAAGALRLAYFELAPDWLWQGADLPAAELAVVDADGRVLHGAPSVGADTSRIFAEHITLTGEQNGTLEALSWQEGGRAWYGVLKQVGLGNAHVAGVPWAVVAYAPERASLAGNSSAWRLLPLVLLVALIGALLTGRYLARRYDGALAALLRGCGALERREPIELPPAGADEPRQLIEAFNRAAASVHDQFQALEILGEIDKRLLGSADLEAVLSEILARVRIVTRCHSVGITLCDADAPGRARVYLASGAEGEMPVTRVELDDGMLSTLSAESNGLTIARCEDVRHSFLKPMRALGAEFFWVWPVKVAERLEAILAVGYAELPAVDPFRARVGGQFAERLAVALSKNEHDERLYRQAHFDPLTSLPNRVLFRDRLAQEISNATAGISRGALLYIDLDHFKRVNDSVGHAAGDQLLAIVAQRLRSCVKDGDTVARLGGDEFTVILRNVTDPDATRAVADRIIESIELPVNIAGRDHKVRASVGITLFPDDGTTIDEVTRNADTAMYLAKDLGRGCATFFDPNMNRKTASPTPTGLHRALRRREFSLFYQPQFAVANGVLLGVEALLRWQTAGEGVRRPQEFIPAAEESGLIVDIGGWVFDAACAQLAAWRDQDIAPPRLSLNVSAQQLRHADFPHVLRRALEKHGLQASWLELEVTESVLADAGASAGLESVRQLGVSLALDDFRGGDGSLGELRRPTIGTVKLEPGVLEGLPADPARAARAEALIKMAHALGKRVIAEGIETAEQLDFLRERRCDLAQGFYLSRPLSAGAATEMLQVRLLAGRDSPPSRQAVG